MTARAASLLAETRARLDRAGSREISRTVQRFFQEPVEVRGIRAAELKRMAAGLYREIETWPLAERNAFCTELWKAGPVEDAALACYVYHRFARQCGRCEFHLFERWIDRFVDNWGKCDGIAPTLLAASIANDPSLMSELLGWARSPNRWKRRAAAVAFVREAKAGRNTKMILRIASLLHRDPDEMVQKGAGWLLKETYPKKPRETVRWLEERRRSTPRLVLRYAAEKMTPADRRRVLSG